MAILTRKVDYAILVLSYLHRRSAGVSARELADRLRLSRPFVANILKELCHKGFLSSQRGVKGGYIISRPLEEVTLAEFIDALEDHPFRLAACSGPESDVGCTLADGCPVRAPLGEVHRRLRDVLDGVTLAELFASQPAPQSGLLTLGV